MDFYSIARNRELSWLKFNERVLEEALADIPLLEKLKFISIFMSNLEEFFMVRVGSLTDKTLLKEPTRDSKTGWTAQEQLRRIYEEVKILMKKKDEIYKKVELLLNQHNIYDVSGKKLTEEERKNVKYYYEQEVKPILCPQIIENFYPFPFLKNNSFYLVMKVQRNEEKKFALIEVPASLPKIKILSKGDKLRYIRVENIVKEFGDGLFENYKITDKAIINITRNADLTVEEEMDIEDQDFQDVMKKVLRKRKRLQSVRIITDEALDPFVKEVLLKNLNLKKEHIFVSDTPIKMDHSFFLENYINGSEKMVFQAFEPQITPDIDLEKSMIQQIKEEELMLIYPFESMTPLIELLKEASRDSRVKSIKITIYRLAEHSKIVEQLVNAAENGKEVTVLIELRARFDEQNNIDYSEILKQAGVKIVYGQPGYKVHSKICLIILEEEGKESYITQFGTGNYNENTSKQYTDICYFTSNKDKGEDTVKFFDNLKNENLEGDYKELLTAPNLFKPKLIELMDQEIAKGEDGFLFFKFNSLSDKKFIKRFYKASEAGCKVQLIIRGICCLKPGLPNIEIHSIVGRFLEHSRVYIFGKGEDQKIYISSADLMTRNTERRVELAVPIYNEKLKKRLNKYMEIQWMDDIKGRVHTVEGDYIPIKDGANISSQDYFMKQAMERSL